MIDVPELFQPKKKKSEEPELLMQVWWRSDGTLTAALPYEDMEPGTYRLVKTDGS